MLRRLGPPARAITRVGVLPQKLRHCQRVSGIRRIAASKLRDHSNLTCDPPVGPKRVQRSDQRLYWSQ
jgi:hypothetical protein